MSRKLFKELTMDMVDEAAHVKEKVDLALDGWGRCPAPLLKKEMIAVKAKPLIVSTKPIMEIPNAV